MSADAPQGAGALVAASLVLAGQTLLGAAEAASDLGESPAIVAQATALMTRAGRLGQRNAASYAAARRLLDADPEGSDQAIRDYRLGAALREAAEAPIALAETGADIAHLAAHLAAQVGEPLRADAIGAAAVAAGAAQAAAHLVAVNLGTVPRDPRVKRASRAAASATALLPVPPSQRL